MRFTRRLQSFDYVNILLFSVFAIVCFYPFYYLMIYSVSNSTEVARNTPWLWPRGFTLFNYKMMLTRGEIAQSFLVSSSRAVVGTFLTVVSSSFFAYLLTQRRLAFRRAIYRLLIITMYLNAGLIPYFIVMRTYRLNNSFLLYVLPSAIGAFYVVLAKTFIENLPSAMEEAAKIDGAGHISCFIRVIFPVCKPILATIAIFSAVNQWNAWQDNFYLVRVRELKTMQLQLLEYLQSMDASLLGDINVALERAQRTSSLSLKACVSVITMVPVMIVYPLFQRYFVKGIMIGSVKG